MLELKDYLNLSRSSARGQWESIIGRAPVVAPVRQVDFSPVETLLCFGLGLVGAPGASGMVNIHESDPNAVALASLFRRSPGSLALKLANLDGRRENGAKNERALWISLTADLFVFEHLYELIFDAARSLGLDEDKLPDFLGTQTKSLSTVLEADRVSAEDLRNSIDDQFRDWYDANPDGDAVDTERAMIGTARVGQTRFSRAVLDNSDYSCAFCGLDFKSAGLPSSRMLVASHIKSWRYSDNRERLDPRNGLASCPTHDASFDTFLEIARVGDGVAVR